MNDSTATQSSLVVVDFTVADHGTIFILTPFSQAAFDWVAEHIPADAQRWGDEGIVVEHRYIRDIVEGLQADGLSIKLA